MTIQEGLFQLDMTDHHAVLGFSLAAAPKQVRQRYLKIARKLHPDSLREASDKQRKLASELLSKQVNPAYEALSQDKTVKEHKILLKMKRKQLIDDPSIVTLKSEAAKKLLNARSIEADYTAALTKIAATQFDDLSRVEAAIGELSELNAVYLMRQQSAENTARQKAQTGAQSGSRTRPQSDAQNNTGNSNAAAVGKTSTGLQRGRTGSRQSPIIQSYLKRAQEFESQQDYSRGILELREAITSHPKSAPCHAYLARLYLSAGQATLAKIHAKQALTFDPENNTAQTVQSKLMGQGGKKAAAKKGQASAAKGSVKKNTANSQKAGDKKKGGGLLSGLFGGKKR
ncbi:MAG: J domain-containing protein [Cyanobacteria bacterium J06627_32]